MNKIMSKVTSTTNDVFASDENNNNNNSNSAPMSLERKLELLESRFTMPSSTTSPAGRAEPAAFTSSSHPNNNNNNNNNNNSGNNSSSTPSASNNNNNNSNLALSEEHSHSHSHSFSFTSPLSKSGLSRSDHSVSASNNIPSSAVRSRRRPSLTTNLHAVSMAAAKHMRRVAASSPVGGAASTSLPSNMLVIQRADNNPARENNNSSNNHSRSMSLLPSTPSSFASGGGGGSNSNQTLLTSHVQQRIGAGIGISQVRVAETPPVPVTPHFPGATAAAPLKPAAARNILLSSTSNASTSTSAVRCPWQYIAYLYCLNGGLSKTHFNSHSYVSPTLFCYFIETQIRPQTQAQFHQGQEQ
jgi:hypothetical protein